MADNKLFYKVAEVNAESFKDAKKDENVIGLISPSAENSYFGYFISGGQQYGPSEKDIERIVETKVTKPNGQGSFSANGADYTISFDENGTISVSKYIAVSVSSVTLPKLAYIPTNIGGGTFYVGYSYTVTVGIDISSTQQDISATFKNDTKQGFEVKVYDGSSYCYTYYMPAGLPTSSIAYFTSDVMSDVANQTYPGIVEYNESCTPSVSTFGEKTFTVYVDDGKTVKSSSKTQTRITVSAEVNPKTIFAYGISKEYVITELDGSNYISKKLTNDGDNTYASSGDYENDSKPSSVSMYSGTPTVVFHESLGTPTFYQLNAPDNAWSYFERIHVKGVYDNVVPNDRRKIDAPAYYLIYQHTPTQNKGTWDITWS